MRKLSRILIGVLLVLTIASCSDISMKAIITQKVATSRPPKVLVIICLSPPSAEITSITNALAAYSDIKSVDFWDGSVTGSAPTVAQLQAYDVVFLETDFAPIANLCDNVAQYLDGGGRVVLGAFDWSYSSAWEITGRLLSQYSPFQTAAASLYTYANLGTYTSGHPVMAGVKNFSAYFRDSVSLSGGATGIANWTDGYPLAAEEGHVVALDAALHISNVDNPGFGWTGDGYTLLHNAVLYIWHKL